MQNNKDTIREELTSLIAKGNSYLNEAQNKQKVVAYLYIIFSLFALSFFGLVAISPTITTISNLRKEYKEGKVALQDLIDKNKALNALSIEYVSIQPDLYLIDNAIPQSPRISEIIRQIEYMIKNNGLSVQKLESGLVEIYPTKNINTRIFSYPLSINISGAEKNVNEFIGNLINMGRILSIERLVTGDSKSYRTASITCKVFFYKDNIN